jgi:hypothetical protein
VVDHARRLSATATVGSGSVRARVRPSWVSSRSTPAPGWRDASTAVSSCLGIEDGSLGLLFGASRRSMLPARAYRQRCVSGQVIVVTMRGPASVGRGHQ